MVSTCDRYLSLQMCYPDLWRPVPFRNSDLWSTWPMGFPQINPQVLVSDPDLCSPLMPLMCINTQCESRNSFLCNPQPPVLALWCTHSTSWTQMDFIPDGALQPMNNHIKPRIIDFIPLGIIYLISQFITHIHFTVQTRMKPKPTPCSIPLHMSYYYKDLGYADLGLNAGTGKPAMLPKWVMQVWYFNTPWHTLYPYCSVMGIHGLISYGKSLCILFLLLFLKHFIYLLKVLTKKDWSFKL